MRIALGQTNSTVGDLGGNARRISDFAHRAASAGAQTAVFPELALTGYPPRDLLEKRTFLDAAEASLHDLAAATAQLPLTIVCGSITPVTAEAGNHLYNSAVVLRAGEIAFRQHKMLLPTYDVFDEARYFRGASAQHPVEIAGTRTAITICEDVWNDKQFWERRRRYSRDPVEELAETGCTVLISINASPYDTSKRALRRQMLEAAARHYRMPVIYVNQVGGNDQLVFDGTSFAVDAGGRTLAQAASFTEDLVLVDTASGTGDWHANLPDECEAVYQALVLGTADYVHKCGFRRVLIGLSGGIDSTLVAAVAVDAVGRENVTGIAMPGPFSSTHSVADARSLAANLGIRFEVVPIGGMYESALRELDTLFGSCPRDVTEENLQSRLRGMTLMALSNKWGALVLTTGNKSELAVGYCTLYGDMCGGLAVISDVPKTMVYQLAHVANRRHAGAIPENVFVKPPSAELRPDQKDTDSLPPYDVLDPILRAYIEMNESPRQIAATYNVPLNLVRDIVTKVDRNEYKRQQAAPGLKVTSKAFGIGRRFPIAQRFTE